MSTAVTHAVERVRGGQCNLHAHGAGVEAPPVRSLQSGAFHGSKALSGDRDAAPKHKTASGAYETPAPPPALWCLLPVRQ